MKGRKLRVAVYSGVVPSTTFIENLIRSLSAHNVEILIFGTLRSLPDYHGCNVKVYPTLQGTFSRRIQLVARLFALLFKDFKAFRYLLLIYNKDRSIDRIARYAPVLLHKPDIFHVQWAKSISQWMDLKKKFNIKLLLSLRGAHINYSPLADSVLSASYKDSFPLLDGIHTVSLDLLQKGYEFGAIPAKSRLIHTGISQEFIVDDVENKSTWDDPVSIISIGRMHWKKGYDIALDALARLKGQSVPFKYSIVGGKISEELLYQLDDLELNDHVEFIDRMKHKEVYVRLHQSDLLLLPSVEEGIANVAVEAMARGTLVLSSDCGGMPELIEDGKTGFLFRSYDPADLAGKLQEIMALPMERINEIRKNALEHVKANYTLNRLGEEMSTWYQEVAAS